MKNQKGSIEVVMIMLMVCVMVVCFMITLKNTTTDGFNTTAKIWPVPSQKTRLLGLKTKKPYYDNGAGIMTIKDRSMSMTRKAYLQWEKDFPKRAESTTFMDMEGHSSSYFLTVTYTQ